MGDDSAGSDRLRVVRVTSERVDSVVPLFDAYRRFYGKPTNLEGARQFLSERLARGESTIFAVFDGESTLGFTQLYPSFSSVSMGPIWILNDLFVVENARKRGVATRLLHAARDHARSTGALRLCLSTAITNTNAQSLYERHGWQRDEEFYHYECEVA